MNKLLELQKALKPIKKDSKNPHFKNTYFDINTVLEVVLPELNKLDLCLAQPIQVIDGKNVLTTLILDGETQLIESEILLPDLQDPQKLGGAITYYRRYAIVCLLGLEAEDDDGNTANKTIQTQVSQDFEATGLVRFKPPYMEDQVQFKALTDYLKANGSRFDNDNKCWWIKPEVEAILKKKFNQN